MIADWMFATLLYALLAAAGYTIAGPLGDFVVWRTLFILAVGAHVFGYRQRMRREEVDRARRYNVWRPPWHED